MAGSAKSDVKFGVFLAAGFFLFGLVLAVGQWILTRARQQAGD